MKYTKVVLPAEAGISSVPQQVYQEDPGFRRDDAGVGLLRYRILNKLWSQTSAVKPPAFHA
jgi:hypothetical protein